MERPSTSRSPFFLCDPVRVDRPGDVAACFVPDRPPEKPDPAIYSQEEQLALGFEPTWNSPDITTNQVSPWKLLHETEVIVRNLSATTDATNAVIDFYTSLFGIGTSRTLLTSQVVRIPAQQEILLKYPLTKEILDGDQRIGVHVAIRHPYDLNRNNNAGSQVVSGSYTSEAGRQLTVSFPVVNATPSALTMTLAVFQNDVNGSVTPVVHQFAPWEQITASLQINVPGYLHGTPEDPLRREITVVGRDQPGGLVGGMTHVLRIDD